jgi:hypothetical protein
VRCGTCVISDVADHGLIGVLVRVVNACNMNYQCVQMHMAHTDYSG